MPNAADETADVLIQRTLDLEGFRLASVTEVRKLLRLLQADIVRQMELNDPTGETGGLRNKVLERLLRSTKEVIDDSYANITDVHAKQMTALAKDEAIGAADAMNTGVGLDLFKPAVLDDNYLKYVASSILIEGSPAADWWAGQAVGTQTRLANAIRVGMLSGDDLGDMINRIRGTKVKDFRNSTMELSAANAEALIRTSILTVANAARLHAYEQNTDVIAGLQWVSTLDERTTPICNELDGKMWKLPGLEPIGHSDVFPGPLAHWGCRSTQVPVLKSWSELAGKKVPDVTGKLTFDGAFRKRLSQKGYSSSEIDKIVADRKAKMDGKSLNMERLGVVAEDKKAARKKKPKVNYYWQDIMKSKELEIMGNKTESGHLYDPVKDKLLFSKEGNEYSVSFTDAELESMADMVLTHNHPVNSSFSGGDLAIAIRRNLQQIRVVSDRNGRGPMLYTFTRPPRGWPKDAMEFLMSWEFGTMTAKAKVRPDMPAGATNLDFADAWMAEFWRMSQQRFPWIIYEKAKHPRG